ncbi:MAG: MBL fold metallo-hydrolase, partial [Candidatus Rokuibacteriota bacterium]
MPGGGRAKVLGPARLIATLVDLGWFPSEQGVRFGKSGKVQPLGPQITITQVRAEHSPGVTVADPTTKKSHTYLGGEPAGFIIQLENGFKLYHMGDTGLFGGMRLIGEYYKPDLIMIPIGDRFVMDPVDAASATREMLKPKYAIPFHYGTSAAPSRCSRARPRSIRPRSGAPRRRSSRSTRATRSPSRPAARGAVTDA